MKFIVFFLMNCLVAFASGIIIDPAPFSLCKADLECQDVCLSNNVRSTFKCIKDLGICSCPIKYDEKASPVCFRSSAPNSISQKCYKDCNSIMAHAESTDPRVCLSDRNKDNYFYRCTCFAKL